jgi:hypothetical protein
LPASGYHVSQSGIRPRNQKEARKTSNSSQKIISNGNQSAHWFHQEFISTLPKCEFRVFIATKPSKESLRSRIGYVIAVAKTTFIGLRQALAVRAIVAEDLEPLLAQSDLENFALFVFEGLRARADSMINFESLEVGVRLDIGVANSGLFFVNEITRLYGAHFFSHNICAEPRTQICKAFATSFNAYISGGMSSMFYH